MLWAVIYYILEFFVSIKINVYVGKAIFSGGLCILWSLKSYGKV